MEREHGCGGWVGESGGEGVPGRRGGGERCSASGTRGVRGSVEGGGGAG